MHRHMIAALALFAFIAPIAIHAKPAAARIVATIDERLTSPRSAVIMDERPTSPKSAAVLTSRRHYTPKPAIVNQRRFTPDFVGNKDVQPFTSGSIAAVRDFTPDSIVVVDKRSYIPSVNATSEH